MASFRITTYNIHKCRGLDRRVRPKRIAEVLREIDADVVALQEVVGLDEVAREHNQVHAIAEELGFDFRIGENRRIRGAAYGNAVLSRFPFVSEHNHDLTCKKYEPRGGLEVVLQLPRDDRAIRIFNVHLGTSFFERRYQAHRLLEVVDAEVNQMLDGSASGVERENQFGESSARVNPDPITSLPSPVIPRIILGDFNEWTRGLTTRVLSHHFNSAEPERRLGRARTYPGVLPILHLDHVYYDSSLQLKSIFAHRSRLSLVASDHLPVVAEFSVVK